MEIVKWTECCVQMERLWPPLRLPSETVEAWFEAFGQRADYATVHRTLMRLVETEERAPKLATIRAAYRDVDGGVHRRRPHHDELEDRNARQRRAVAAVEWQQIRAAMRRHPRIREMFDALRTQYGDDITDAQGTLCRLALIDEIKHLTPDEIAAASADPAPAVDDDDPGPVEPSPSEADDDPFAAPFTPVGEAVR